MAPIKRKDVNAQDGATLQPQKRARVGAGQQSKSSKKTSTRASGPSTKERPEEPIRGPDAETHRSDLSIMRDEEPAFPRGGGSVLTPLERKQIQIQATQDVLFPQKHRGKTMSNLPGGDDDMDMDIPGAEDASLIKKSRKMKSKGKKNTKPEAPPKQDVRIEGLSFKVCPRSNRAHYPGADCCSALFRARWCWVRFPASTNMTLV
jgi:rRNA biogenesis protein RRP5